MHASQTLHRPFYRAASITLFILCCFAAASAQTTTSTITGEIRDTNGAVLKGAQVTALHIETGLARSTVSTDDGRFVFPGLPVGVYEITSELTGFQKLVHKDVNLTVGETLSINLTMIVASITENVEIVGGEALVNTQSQELSYLVG